MMLFLPLAVCVKELHYPERLAAAGSGTFDFSFLHSHSLWHLCVWFLQLGYLACFLTALGPGAGTGVTLLGPEWAVVADRNTVVLRGAEL